MAWNSSDGKSIHSTWSRLNEEWNQTTSSAWNGTRNWIRYPTVEEENYLEIYRKTESITGIFCYPLLCLFGLTGNILSIVVLRRLRRHQTPTNTYLVALALSDTIKLLTDSIYFVVILVKQFDPVSGARMHAIVYPYAHYFFNMSICTTAWLTVSVAVERYSMVCRSRVSASTNHMFKATTVCALVFLSMTVITIPMGLRYRAVQVYHPQTKSIVFEVQLTSLWRIAPFVTVYTWIQSLLRSIVPLLILCLLNFHIVRALRRRRRRRTRSSSSSQLQRVLSAASHRTNFILLSVIGLFLVCVTPDAVMSTVFGFGYYEETSYLVKTVREITDLLLTVNSALNFLLYCTFSASFRRQFVLMVLCRCCSRYLLVGAYLGGANPPSPATAGDAAAVKDLDEGPRLAGGPGPEEGPTIDRIRLTEKFVDDDEDDDEKDVFN